MPAAEVDVTGDLVRRLLAEQHPDLARIRVELLANGWDNVMFRVGDELAARLPRREMAAGILPNEQRWLPGQDRLFPDSDLRPWQPVLGRGLLEVWQPPNPSCGPATWWSAEAAMWCSTP
jgi:hypothetical protein